MRIWIDVENGAGAKLGGGPITSATRWRSVKRLDRAGTFEFEMPAGDAKASLLAEKRVVRCYGLINGTVQEVGAGIIDRITTRPARGGPTMLRVAGDDLLRELTYRSVGLLDLVGVEQRTPDSLVHFVAPSTYTTLSNALDGNPATSSTLTLAAANYLYIGDDAPFQRVVVDVATANSNSARLLAEYWDGSAWSALQIVDGTASGGKAFAQDGTIEVEQRSNWATTAVNSVTRYWIRLAPHAATSSMALAEVEVESDVLSTTALAEIMAFAPSGWSLDVVNGYGSTAEAIYARFAGESALAALVKMGETLGEHFRLGAGRSVVWLRGAGTSSGLRAVRVPAGVAFEDASELALIVDLEQVANSYDLVTRVYPFGAGEGEARLTLAASTDTPPAGYSIDRSANYIEHDAAAISYGRIERYLQWKEIGPLSNTAADLGNAANALQAVATEFLARNCEPYASYKLRLAKVHQALEPGQTLRVVYAEYGDGFQAVAIDEELVVLEATTEIGPDGLRTVAVQVASTDRWPAGDQERIIGQMQQGTIYQAYPQLNANTYTTHYQPHMDADTPASFRFRLGNEVVQVQEVVLEFQLVQLISTVRAVATATTSNGGAATVTSAGESNHTHQYGVDDDSSGTQYNVNIKPNAGGAGVHRLVANTGGTSYTIDTGAGGTHAHDVVIANHTHTVTPTLTYGIYEAPVNATFILDDLEYRVNGGSWAGLAEAVKPLGDGWFLLDLTADLCDNTTLRPLRISNTVQMRRKTSGSFASRAHCQVDALLQVRNIIQSVSFR